MKKTKAILMALCAVLLVAASVMGTLAYLTSTDTVTNTFTVGKVAITLDEAPVDANGQKTNGPRRTSNEYHLLPGHRYDKDPTVHVAADSEDCYLFVKVVNEIADIEAPTTIANQMTANGWAVVDPVKGIYVYGPAADPTPVSAGQDKKVFDNFTILGTVTNDDLAGREGSEDNGVTIPPKPGYKDATIVVTAYAVQADGFANKTAAEIWTAASFT